MNSIFLSLLPLFAVACGDPGAMPTGEEADLGGDFAGDAGGTGGDPGIGQGGAGGTGDIDAPFCGDGFIDEAEECDDGNQQDGDGCSSTCAIEVFAGESEGEVAIHLIIDDLGSNTAPAEADCVDTIAVVVNDGVLGGEGRCFLPSNFLDYELDADVDENGAVEGTIDVVLNGTTHVLDIAGALEDGVLFLEFSGMTLATTRIRLVWNGTVEADFND